MKSNKIFLSIVCVGAFLFSSCTDFLKEEPKSSLPAETFFSSKALVEAAVNNLYRNALTNWTSPGVYNGNNFMMGGWSSGLFDNLVYKGQEFYIEYAQKFEMTPNNVDTKMSTLWNDPYTYGISRANAVITILPDIDLINAGMTEDDRERYIAEARFFRAYNYLWLVRHFGNVPLMLKPQTAADDLNVPRTDAKTIYEQVIIPDLQKAIEILPVKAQYNNSGRISAIVASAVLIDACVQMAGYPIQDATKWTMAAVEAKKFLPGGAYATEHSLCINEDFEELSAYNQFRSVGVQSASPGGRRTTTCSEFIYIHEFKSGDANAGFSQNAWPTAVNGLGSSECIPLTNNAYKPMPRYLAMYDTINVRDLRMKDRQYFAKYFDKKDGSRLYNPEDNTPTPYFYYDWGAVKVQNSSGRHFAYYRLAEMYLFAAEIIAQTDGVTTQAIDALATIRARAYEWGYTKEEIDAGKPKSDIVAELTGLSKEQFIEQVWLERFRELVFEFKDWNLIQRTRKYPKTHAMDASIPVGTAQFVDITTVGTDFSTKNFSIDNLLWPIPQTQMQRNPALAPNNPGYGEN